MQSRQQAAFSVWAALNLLKRISKHCESHWLLAGFRPGAGGSASAPTSLEGARDMPESFTSALLAALNDSTVVKESEWAAVEAVLRGHPIKLEPRPVELASENRFAATISSGMAKVRSSL
jgi:hypothetical protein